MSPYSQYVAPPHMWHLRLLTSPCRGMTDRHTDIHSLILGYTQIRAPCGSVGCRGHHIHHSVRLSSLYCAVQGPGFAQCCYPVLQCNQSQCGMQRALFIKISRGEFTFPFPYWKGMDGCVWVWGGVVVMVCGDRGLLPCQGLHLKADRGQSEQPHDCCTGIGPSTHTPLSCYHVCVCWYRCWSTPG